MVGDVTDGNNPSNHEIPVRPVSYFRFLYRNILNLRSFPRLGRQRLGVKTPDE